MSEQDWAHEKAYELVNEYFYIPEGLDSKPEGLVKDVAEALREARKIDWPQTLECMAACSENKKNSSDEHSYEAGFRDAIIWLKSYIEERRK